MFIKLGTIIAAEKTTLADWRRHIVAADKRQDPEGIETLAEFDLDTSNFVYVRARAVSAYEMHGLNGNGDGFLGDELSQAFRTFIRRGAYINHASESPEKAIGIILDASWHPKEGFVQVLIAVDKSHPIADKVAKGMANSWSMGCMCESCECTHCGAIAKNADQYCFHLSNYMGKEYNGKKVGAINHGLNFYEISNVTIPADPEAYTLQVFASKNPLPDKFEKLAEEYNQKVQMISDSTNSVSLKEGELSQVVSDVRGKLNQNQPKTSKDGQILSMVRKKLKAAKAPLILQEKESVHRRVQAALEAQGSSAEKQKTQIEEANTVPMEGLKVENQLTIHYIPGNSLKDCYFVARKGNLEATVSAEKILDKEIQEKIVSAEKKIKAGKGAEQLKDDSKPKADSEHKLGDEEAQPGKKLKDLGKSEELKDDSKPKADHIMEVGKEPMSPSDVVKKYAQMVGSKSISYKNSEKNDGAFTATLVGGSIARLASLWGTAPSLSKTAKLAKTAKIAGEPMGYAREHAEGEGKDMREMPGLAREDKSKEAAKPSGSSGSEMKSYFQKLDSKNLAQGGGEQWARKVAELTKKASDLESDNKALKAELDTVKTAFESQKREAINRKKAELVHGLVSYMEKMGGVRANDEEILDLRGQGFSYEDAQVKAYSNAKDRKIAELKDLDVKALETMVSNFSEMVPEVQTKTASRKDMELPISSRDEFTSEEDSLAKDW